MTNNVTCYLLLWHWSVPMEAHLKLTHDKILQSAKQQTWQISQPCDFKITCDFQVLLISLGVSTVKWTTLDLGTSLSKSDSKLYTNFGFCEKIVSFLKKLIYKAKQIMLAKKSQKKSSWFRKRCKWWWWTRNCHGGVTPLSSWTPRATKKNLLLESCTTKMGQNFIKFISWVDIHSTYEIVKNGN